MNLPTLSECRIIKFLDKYPGTVGSVLNKKTKIKGNYIYIALSRLRRKGYITRIKSDARNTYYKQNHLTLKGKHMAEFLNTWYYSV